MGILALAAWLAGVAVSYYNGNRKLPTVILLLGIAIVVATATGHAGVFGTAGLALLAAIIWIANKADNL